MILIGMNTQKILVLGTPGMNYLLPVHLEIPEEI